VRVATASKQPRPASDPHRLVYKRPRERAAAVRRRVESLARTLEIVSTRTMIQKEEGVRYSGLPGLSSTMLFAFFMA